MKKQKNDNTIKLVMTIGRENVDISSLDMRKYELINYYVNQNKDEKEDQIEMLKELVAESFTAAINKQYKKYVPAQVRTMYEELLAHSSVFGAMEEKSEIPEPPAEEKTDTFRENEETPAEKI